MVGVDAVYLEGVGCDFVFVAKVAWGLAGLLGWWVLLWRIFYGAGV